jgi:hypothetical protein
VAGRSRTMSFLGSTTAMSGLTDTRKPTAAVNAAAARSASCSATRMCGVRRPLIMKVRLATHTS